MVQVLDEVPPNRADWILWVDMDVILADTLFDFPFTNYGGKDLVMWGRADDIARGNPHGAPLYLLRDSYVYYVITGLKRTHTSVLLGTHTSLMAMILAHVTNILFFLGYVLVATCV